MYNLINKSNIIILIYVYLGLGLLCIIFNKPFYKFYIFLIFFILFKWLFNYRKCTISRIECILRGVKKNNGYLYTFLETITDIRYNNHIIVFIVLSLYILYIHYIVNDNILTIKL
jgi:hypothetical protein